MYSSSIPLADSVPRFLDLRKVLPLVGFTISPT